MTPAGGWVVVGQAQQADLVLDTVGQPDECFAVVDWFYARLGFQLTDLVYEDALRCVPRPVRRLSNLPVATVCAAG